MLQKISLQTYANMKKKSTLPDNPTAQGYKPADIRRALLSALLGTSDSMYTEVNRIVDEINEEIISKMIICESEGSETIKAISIPNFTWQEGMWLFVYFNNDNTASCPTLSINGGTGKIINIDGNPFFTPSKLKKGLIPFLMWDGDLYTGRFLPIKAGEAKNADCSTEARDIITTAILAGETLTNNGIAFGASDGKYYNLVGGAQINISLPILYNNTKSYIKKSGISSSALSMVGLVANKPIYLVGILIGNVFTLAVNNFVTQDEPVQDDGKQYLFIGCAETTNTWNLDMIHKVYEFKHNTFSSRIGTVEIVNELNSDETDKSLSAAQGKALKRLIDREILDRQSEIETIDGDKISFDDIIDDLITQAMDKPLSAKQGYILKGLIDGIKTKTDFLDYDSARGAGRMMLTPKAGESKESGNNYTGIYVNWTEADLIIIGEIISSTYLQLSTTGKKGVILGNRNTANNGMAIGHDLDVGDQSVGVGWASNGKNVIPNNCVVVGIFAKCKDANGVAIGASAYSEGAGTAIGQGARATDEGVAIGKTCYATKKGSVAIGKSVGVDGFVEIGDVPDQTILGDSDLQAILRVAGVTLLKYDAVTGTYYIPSSLVARALPEIINNLTSTDTNKPLSAAQGKALKDAIDAINILLSSDDTTLDTLQEIVTYVKNNRTLLAGITTDKVNVSDIINNLTSDVSNKPLSAAQGYALKGLIDTLSTAINNLPAWSKAQTKPTYTPQEVGAEPTFQKNTAFNKNFGNAAGSVCEGNDPRLSDPRPASDVPNAVKEITAQDIANWNGILTKPAMGISQSDINKWNDGGDAIGIKEGDSISTLYFNPNVSASKLETFLSSLTLDVATGMTGNNEIATILETAAIESIQGVYGVYSVDLTMFGGTGHALAVCAANENGFTIVKPLYITEYSATNEAILQYFPGLSSFTYSAGGWQDSTPFQIGETTTIYTIVGGNKVSAIIGKNTKLWDIISMF